VSANCGVVVAVNHSAVGENLLDVKAVERARALEPEAIGTPDIARGLEQEAVAKAEIARQLAGRSHYDHEVHLSRRARPTSRDRRSMDLQPRSRMAGSLSGSIVSCRVDHARSERELTADRNCHFLLSLGKTSRCEVP
jgi:hypothetical protein